MALRLLFVEDDQGQRTLFNDALREWNNAHPDRSFELREAVDYAEAERLLACERFDGALLDLRLPGGGRLPGNKLAESCLRQYGIPAGVISGNPADIDRNATHGLLEVFDKGDNDAHEKAVAWFGGLWPMMETLAGARKKIQALGAKVFSHRVWPRWETYEALAGVDQDALIGIVSRQYASHIADVLGVDREQGPSWHPFENYIQPALQETRPHTGDLFCLDKKIWVVLTPQCDMATAKAPTVLLACCEQAPDTAVWAENIANRHHESATKRDKADKFFRALINQNEPARHFLPPLTAGKPLMVDFKQLKTVALDDLVKSLDARIASIAGPFLTNLTQRFGAYVSRVGQPDIDIRHLS